MPDERGDDAEGGARPHRGKHPARRVVVECEDGDWGVGGGDGHEDHRMVESLHDRLAPLTPLTPVIEGADAEQTDDRKGVDGDHETRHNPGSDHDHHGRA